jgi:hypothetical protein
VRAPRGVDLLQVAQRVRENGGRLGPLPTHELAPLRRGE